MSAEAQRPGVLLEVDGMFCGSCARALGARLADVEGVTDAQVSFATGVAQLRLRPETCPARVQRDAMESAKRLGYPSRPWTFDPHGARRAAVDQSLGIRLALGAFLGMWVMVAQLVLYVAPALTFADRSLLARASAIAATPVVFVVGYHFHLAAYRTLRAGVPGMDVLVSAGALGAWSLSMLELLRGHTAVWFDAAAMLVVFLLVGRALEASARRRSVDAVRALLDLSPTRVNVVERTGALVPTDITDVPEDALVQVPPFTQIALDGRVELGQSSVDRALLTGETQAAPVGIGDDVQAGCRNGEGVLRVRVTATVGSRVLDGIACEVRKALDRQAEPTGLEQTLLARWVPAVGLLSVATTALWWALGLPPHEAILRGLTVLVVTCPCALSLARPLAQIVAMGRAAKRGLLVRGDGALQRAERVDVVAFDKTGTLTVGRPSVWAVEPEEGVCAAQLLTLAASAEEGSEHPLAKAIRREAGKSEGEGEGTRHTVAGVGVRWQRRDGSTIRVGSRDFFADALLSPRHAQASEVWVAQDERVLGRILLTDIVRLEAEAVVRRLRERGVALRLWSGDGAGPVADVAHRLGLREDEIEWELSPRDKAERVRVLQRRGACVLFVGDGLNDAPALAEADVGVAIIDAVDSARAAADAVVRSGSLERVEDLLVLGRETAARVRFGLGWAVAYNALALPLAFFGGFGPHWAALAMVASSLSVTLNAIRPMPQSHGHAQAEATACADRELGPSLATSR